MELDEFCENIKAKYPDISLRADALYDAYWNDLIEMEFSSYSWFESLANAINDRMKKKCPAVEYMPILRAISEEFGQGNSEVDKAIDVAFVENLFWQVLPADAEPYWSVMPNNLKELYVGFHSKPPL